MPLLARAASFSAMKWALSREPAMDFVTWISWMPFFFTATIPCLMDTWAAYTSGLTAPSGRRSCSRLTLGLRRPSSSRIFRSGSEAPTPTSQRSCRSFSSGLAMSMTTVSIFTQVSPRFFVARIFSLMVLNFASEDVFLSLTTPYRSCASLTSRWVRRTRFLMRFLSSSGRIRSGMMRKQLVWRAFPLARNFAISASIGQPALKPAARSFQNSFFVRKGIWTSEKSSRLQCDLKMNMATKRS
mmetsp:Transcript_52159/g.153931  ORF Transcript_52159/g.153931 Transcript_52159/m.153931 type:complete len:242 (+) Transcript_52159:542-1267(+)